MLCILTIFLLGKKLTIKMKKLSIIPILFYLNCIHAQKIGAKKIIGQTYKVKNYKHHEFDTIQFNTISNLEIAEHDFPNKMNWNEAIAACAKLGQGWRLPTYEEKNVLYKYIVYVLLENSINKKKAIHLSKVFPRYGEYWCDTIGIYKTRYGPIGVDEGGPIYNSLDSIKKMNSELAYYIHMNYGYSDGGVTNKSRICSVRAIKSL